MAEIRALQRGDLEEVAGLLRENLPVDLPEGDFEESLRRTFVDPAWSDDELPSLVAVEEGRVVGFIGSQVRRFKLDESELRAVCPSHLTVSPQSRGAATGALLLRRLLTAGQDFTFADTANEEVARMWRTFGAGLDAARTCDWMVVLKPGRWLGALVGDTAMRRPLKSDRIPVGALPFRAIRPPSRRRFTTPPGISGEDVDSATIVEGLAQMARGVRLRVDYDAAYLDRLFADIEAQFGPVVRRLVRRDGRPLGWYAYVARRGGAIRVLHLLADGRDGDVVIDELLAHARDQGGALVTGRLEPHLVLPLQTRLPILALARRPWIHCRNPELRAALGDSASLLTQLDGEWFVT